MANVDKHAPGSFSWVELATTDQSAAKTFYTGLFGWAVTDNPMGPNEYYSIFKLKGRDVAAGYTLRKDQRDRGVPVHWSLYIATDNADQTAAKATDAGGTILMPPMDVMDAGRMAVIHDPTGAVFSIWQPNKTSGLGITGEAGSVCWADLVTPDPGRAQKFYSTVFGWKMEKGANDASGYLHIKNGDHHIGGVPPAHSDPKIPPHWLIYFMVSDVTASVTKATSLGAKTVMAREDMPGVGSWSILGDPQGAVFAIFQSAR